MFCDWGSNILAKLKKFPEDRLVEEFEYLAHFQCNFLFCADANWGIFDRDVELTEKLVEIKNKHGYPKKFRYTSAKNSGDRVYAIAKLLHSAGMNKGATLSFQSMDDNTLSLIKRKNIGTKVFKQLILRYRAEGIATYSELICGLPGETYDTWADGLDTLLNCAQHDSVHCYNTEVLPNSEMNDPEYRKVHGIKTVVMPVRAYHAIPNDDPQQEFNEIVVETKYMSSEDWVRCNLLGWAVQCFHCLGLTQCIAVFLHYYKSVRYREFYEKLLSWGKENPETVLGRTVKEFADSFQNGLKGGGLGVVDKRFGEILWPPEEGGFLKLAVVAEVFYLELHELLKTWLPTDLAFALIQYQYLRIKNPDLGQGGHQAFLRYNIHQYLSTAYQDQPGDLEESQNTINVFVDKDYNGDLVSWAREAVWLDRKGGQFLLPVTIIKKEES